jgi:amidase
VKNNLATADKMQTTAGSLALVGSIVPSDSVVVNRLRAAGAVILGKANLLSGRIFAATRRSMARARAAVSHAIHIC